MKLPLRLLLLKLRKSKLWISLKIVLFVIYGVFIATLVYTLIRKSNDLIHSILSSGDELGVNSRASILERIVAPKEILQFESLAKPGLGAQGSAVRFKEQSDRDIQEQLKIFAFNKYASDRISVRRELPDTRHEECKRILYEEPHLQPKTSVILIFCNEALSVLLRTVWSIIQNTPKDILHEIILVDDGSNSTEITQILPLYLQSRLYDEKVKLHILARQSGLIGARIAGAKVATGDILIFLDSHCEATPGWVEPLIKPIKVNPKTVTIPVIGTIDDKTLQFYGSPGSLAISVGGFTWSGHFTWENYRYGPPDRKMSDPVPTPTMAGGLFAINRNFFFEIGAYDDGMVGWGGENLEISFRTWMCGGRMESIPCSHVGHIFRDTHPYFIPDDSHGRNTARMAEVWMDDYKRFYFKSRQDLKDKDRGDLSKRKALREKLKCHSFKWYLDNVIPHKFIPDEQSNFHGRVSNELYGQSVCFDDLQRDTGKVNSDDYNFYYLGQYPCHKDTFFSQYFCLSKKNEIRNEFMCAEAFYLGEEKIWKVRMVGCNNENSQKWNYSKSDHRLMHNISGLCITPVEDKPGWDLAMKECDLSDQQKWKFDNENH